VRGKGPPIFAGKEGANLKRETTQVVCEKDPEGGSSKEGVSWRLLPVEGLLRTTIKKAKGQLERKRSKKAK